MRPDSIDIPAFSHMEAPHFQAQGKYGCKEKDNLHETDSEENDQTACRAKKNRQKKGSDKKENGKKDSAQAHSKKSSPEKGSKENVYSQDWQKESQD